MTRGSIKVRIKGGGSVTSQGSSPNDYNACGPAEAAFAGQGPLVNQQAIL